MVTTPYSEKDSNKTIKRIRKKRNVTPLKEFLVEPRIKEIKRYNIPSDSDTENNEQPNQQKRHQEWQCVIPTQQQLKKRYEKQVKIILEKTTKPKLSTTPVVISMETFHLDIHQLKMPDLLQIYEQQEIGVSVEIWDENIGEDLIPPMEELCPSPRLAGVMSPTSDGPSPTAEGFGSGASREALLGCVRGGSRLEREHAFLKAKNVAIGTLARSLAGR